MQRRDFIKTTCAACVGTFVVSAFLSACKSSKYIANFTNENKKLSIKKSEFIVVEKGKEKTLKYILLKPTELQFPIAVYKVNDTEYKTVFMQCSHQGCEVEVQGNRFVCPCHGSTYDLEGKVIKGPAEKNLKSFKTSSDNENIYILLS